MTNLRLSALVQAVAWTLLILLLLSIPGRSLPSGSLWRYDKVGHFILFAGLAFLWMRAFEAHNVRMIIVILVCGLFFAPLTELYQSILPIGRQADMKDSLADAAGIFVGTLAWVAFERQKRRAVKKAGKSA